jgi:hypothetical protein
MTTNLDDTTTSTVTNNTCSCQEEKVVNDPIELYRYGIVSIVPIVSNDISYEQWMKWSKEYTIITPEIMANEGDNTYAFYRNILEEPDFPFDRILYQSLSNESNTTTTDTTTPILDHVDSSCEPENDSSVMIIPTSIGQAILESFPTIQSLKDDLRLDDAFCIHYNMNQIDTKGAKHVDPSDITINICLEKSSDCQGSYVRFYGTKQLVLNPQYRRPHPHESNKFNRQRELSDPNDEVFLKERKDSVSSNVDNNDPPTIDQIMKTTFENEKEYTGQDDDPTNNYCLPNEKENDSIGVQSFLVNQEPGYATIHYGNHVHETTQLISGTRTNLILTYCYVDPSKSDVTTRTCYSV